MRHHIQVHSMYPHYDLSVSTPLLMPLDISSVMSLADVHPLDASLGLSVRSSPLLPEAAPPPPNQPLTPAGNQFPLVVR